MNSLSPVLPFSARLMSSALRPPSSVFRLPSSALRPLLLTLFSALLTTPAFAAAAANTGRAGRAGGASGEIQASTPAVSATQSTARSQSEYVLQPQDLIKVEVFRHPDLLREVRVSQDFKITLPLIETISVKDMTVQQAQEKIRQLYDEKYLVNPQVNVMVVAFVKHEVKVLGNVNSPGSVEIPNDRPLRIMGALAGAGGTTRLAELSRVTLTRQKPDGSTETTRVNVADIIASRAEDITLQEGDVINVPERIL